MNILTCSSFFFGHIFMLLPNVYMCLMERNILSLLLSIV
ncbi:hypothetical protein BTJ45_04922 [Bacillus mycoides]|nr:hypothetical protein BTJ45_04922 [Bacillus mycoides]